MIIKKILIIRVDNAGEIDNVYFKINEIPIEPPSPKFVGMTNALIPTAAKKAPKAIKIIFFKCSFILFFSLL